MARMIDASGGGNDTHDKGAEIKISAHGEDRIDLPADMPLADADMTRDGADLVLTSADGSSVVVEGYFTADPAPVIAGAGGASLSPELVNSFLTASPEYARAATASDASPVGAIEEIKGNASVTHADGTTEKLTLGSPIYEGDVIQTDAQGAVNVVFVDETSMAVSANARMAIDDYSFDPATESGTTNFSVLRGVFVFTSGLIGRDDPDDVHIDTPVGSIGIRGTIIAGNINPDGESEITVVEGAIVVKNDVMEKTLAAQFETVRLGGLESDMHDMGVLSAKAVGTAFGAVSDVAPSLFNAINDAAKEQGQDGNSPADAAEDGAEETGEGESDNSQPDAADEPVQDMQMNNLNTPFKDDVFTDTTVKTAESTSAHETATTLTDTIVRASTTNTVATHSATAADSNTAPTYVPDRNNTSTDNTGTNGGTSGGGTIAGPPPTLELTTATQTGDHVSRIGDNIGHSIGYSVTGVGDANGDGYADIMFSNNTSDPGQNHTYVAYGGANGVTSKNLGDSGASNSLSNGIESPQYPSRIGILATATGLFDYSHTIIRGIGDVNGDGSEDYLIGQKLNDTLTPDGSGTAVIVDGSGNVIKILEGLGSLSELGTSITALGDINNDGLNDILIGAPGAATGMDATGKAFVVYGTSTGAVNVNLISAFQGFSVNSGAIVGDRFGESVAGIGDFDGDGYNDYAVGASGYSNEGAVYIYSGASPGSAPLMTVRSQLANHNFGSDVIGLGDINGDGKSDIMMAGDGNSQTGYILFGGSTTSIGNVDTMSGSSGFKFSADAASEILGGGAAGDFNGDGFKDFVVAVSNGAGADADVYVVFGHSIMNAVGADGVLTADALQNPEYAFKMKYTGGGSYDFEFSSAGDTDGDGFDDLIIGIGDADYNVGSGTGNGEVLVVKGREGGDYTYVYDGAAEDTHLGDNSIKASGHEQIVMGSAQNDNLYADIYTDIVMNGGRGDDNMIVRDNSFFSIDGGFGFDTLRLTGTNSTLDLSAIGSERLSHVEALQFSQAGQKIVLTMENIFNLLKSSDDGTLKISFASTGFGDDGRLEIVSDNSYSGSFVDQMQQALGENTNAGNVSHFNDGTYEKFSIGGYTLYIDNAIADTATVGITP